MKLVELLAAKLDKWAGTTVCYVQDPDGCVWPCKETAYRDCGQWGGDHGLIDQSDKAKHFEKVDACVDHDTAIVTRAQWKAERDRQKGGEWKRHRGGKRPVDAGTHCEYRYRDGTTGAGCNPELASWSHDNHKADIMAYKVISQPQAEESGTRPLKDVLGTNFPKRTIIHGPLKMGETVIAPAHPEYKGEDTNMGTLSYTVDIDTSPAMQALNELSAKWDQVESPFKWRDTVNELDAYIEEFTREREELINRLALEGFALIPAMTPVMGVADTYFPIEEWQIGDIVEVVSLEAFFDCGIRIGDQMPITHIDKHDGTAKVASGAWGDEENYKFIRRP